MISAILLREPFFSIAIVLTLWGVIWKLSLRHPERAPFVSPKFRSQNDEGATDEEREIFASSHG
jgi:hypothetical protein